MARALPVLGLDPENTIEANAALIVPVRVAELLVWERHIADPARVTELHQMRIAAKRLRYTMELFAPFYGPEFAAALERIRAIQEQLGGIHDADVLVPQLRDHARTALRSRRRDRDAGVYGGDLDAAAGLLALCRRQRAGRDRLYRKFLATWGRLRAGGFFEALRQMVREPAAGAQAAAPENGAEEDRPVVRAAGHPNTDHAGGRNGKTKAARAGVARGRARRGPGDDPGPGPDPGADADEGGMGQHSLFEEGDPR